jgi:AmmeMemoRadiSam system protein B
MDYPKIRRDVSAFPMTVDGQAMICFQDSQRLSQGAMIPQVLFARVVAFFDGEHSLRDIQYEAMRRYGELVYTDQIQSVVDQLDKGLLLESPRLQETLEKAVREFANQSLRPAFLSGTSYPGDVSDLENQLQEYFTGPDGPGAPVRGGGRPGLKGIIAPHIDFQRGGYCYAWAYKALAEVEEADLYVILGIAHAPTEVPFSLTQKDFETPLGIVRTDKDFVQALARECPKNLFQDEFLHRSEHSIEFQALFLQWVLGPKTKARIVPILCGSFDPYLGRGMVPEDDPSVSEFLEALGSIANKSQERICFVSGVDLAHMGPQFGDPNPVDDLSRRRIGEEDLRALEKVKTCDAKGFFQVVERDMNGRRLCGFPAIYTQLKTMKADRGEILKYGQGPTPDGQSVVSFVAMAFFE